jgi:hypothetical protein
MYGMKPGIVTGKYGEGGGECTIHCYVMGGGGRLVKAVIYNSLIYEGGGGRNWS